MRSFARGSTRHFLRRTLPVSHTGAHTEASRQHSMETITQNPSPAGQIPGVGSDGLLDADRDYLLRCAKKASERIKWAVENGHSEWFLDTAKLLDGAIDRITKSQASNDKDEPRPYKHEH